MELFKLRLTHADKNSIVVPTIMRNIWMGVERLCSGMQITLTVSPVYHQRLNNDNSPSPSGLGDSSFIFCAMAPPQWVTTPMGTEQRA